MTSQDRLFVPMAKESFSDFEKRGKKVELRKISPNFNEETVRPGRPVELRLGYSGKKSIWGVIGQVVKGSLPEIFAYFELADIEPRFETIEDAIEDNHNLMGEIALAIAFEVENQYLVSNRVKKD